MEPSRCSCGPRKAATIPAPLLLTGQFTPTAPQGHSVHLPVPLSSQHLARERTSTSCFPGLYSSPQGRKYSLWSALGFELIQRDRGHRGRAWAWPLLPACEPPAPRAGSPGGEPRPHTPGKKLDWSGLGTCSPPPLQAATCSRQYSGPT